MNNIILIGMPAVGKSTIGRMLAKSLNMNFLDTDDLIKDSCMMPLKDVIEKHGIDGFIKIENAVISACNVTNTVIATGGSAVYGQTAMSRLKENGVVIYIKIDYDRIKLRLRKIKSRGVAIREDQTLSDLYKERCSLYEKYADIVVEEGDKLSDQMVRECLSALEKNKKRGY